MIRRSKTARTYDKKCYQEIGEKCGEATSLKSWQETGPKGGSNSDNSNNSKNN
jgi:hypothetical protein